MAINQSEWGDATPGMLTMKIWETNHKSSESSATQNQSIIGKKRQFGIASIIALLLLFFFSKANRSINLKDAEQLEHVISDYFTTFIVIDLT